MAKPNENGQYAITEQGDLGLGLTPVNESEILKSQKSESDNDENPQLFSK